LVGLLGAGVSIAVGACAEGEPQAANTNPAPTQVEVPPGLSNPEAGIDASVPELQWTRVPLRLDGTSLFDIWGSSSTDVWAVGTAGTILHWDGKEWLPSVSGTSEALLSVWGSGPSDVWTGSTTHNLLHSAGWQADGGGWELKPAATGFNPSTATIYTIRGTGPNDVWAVGDWTIVDVPDFGTNTVAAWHWEGQKWDPVPVVNDFSRPGGDTRVALNSVWPVSSTDVWLGGNFGRTYRNPQYDPKVPIPKTFVRGMGAMPPWQEYDSASRADIERTWGTASRDVWAVGRNGVVRHWDGTSTFLWGAVDTGATDDLHGVWGRGEDDVWVVGDNSTILHWDGTRWTRELSEPLLRLHGIWGDAENMWIVGDGVILRRGKPSTGATQ
jgi:hypothetical protein